MYYQCFPPLILLLLEHYLRSIFNLSNPGAVGTLIVVISLYSFIETSSPPESMWFLCFFTVPLYWICHCNFSYRSSVLPKRCFQFHISYSTVSSRISFNDFTQTSTFLEQYSLLRTLLHRLFEDFVSPPAISFVVPLLEKHRVHHFQNESTSF